MFESHVLTAEEYIWMVFFLTVDFGVEWLSPYFILIWVKIMIAVYLDFRENIFQACYWHCKDDVGMYYLSWVSNKFYIMCIKIWYSKTEQNLRLTEESFWVLDERNSYSRAYRVIRVTCEALNYPEAERLTHLFNGFSGLDQLFLQILPFHKETVMKMNQK